MYFKNIKELRLKNNLKQIEIAKILHISQNTYSDYEKGKITISIDKLIMLSDYYNVSIDYIVGKNKEEEK